MSVIMFVLQLQYILRTNRDLSHIDENRFKYTDSITKSIKDAQIVIAQPNWVTAEARNPILVYDSTKNDGSIVIDRSGNGNNGEVFHSVKVLSSQPGISLENGQGGIKAFRSFLRSSALRYLAFQQLTLSWFGMVDNYNSPLDGDLQHLLTIEFHTNRKVILGVRRWRDNFCVQCRARLEPAVIINNENDISWWHPTFYKEHCEFREGSFQQFTIVFDDDEDTMNLYCNGLLSMRIDFRFPLWITAINLGPVPFLDTYFVRDFRVFNFGFNKHDVRRLLGKCYVLI
jgi:hypothetical protein